MTPSAEWHIGKNVVRVWEGAHTVQTILPDGRTLNAAPERTPEYLERALSLGYGWHPDPAWRLCVEHDPLHLLLAVEMGLETSRTLSDVADGLSLERVGRENVPDYHWTEEGRILDLQLYLNTGDASRTTGCGSIYELSWEIDLPAFRERALHIHPLTFPPQAF